LQKPGYFARGLTPLVVLAACRRQNMRVYEIIQLLTMAALTGLLFATGLRLNPAQVLGAVTDGHRLLRALVINFVVVPLLGVGLVIVAAVPREVSIGFVLLAAAPFAPVVPVFTRMARGDLALAAAFTAVFPVFSSFLTPWVSALSLKCLPGAEALHFEVLAILLVLLLTITLPLLAGVAANHLWPAMCERWLRPVEGASEAIGAVSLVFVSAVEWKSIVTTGWMSLLAMAILFEVAMAIGYWAGGPSVAARRVIALGTGNRNIALAILIAVRSFPGSLAVASVVANGLLLIGLGLLHTAWWRLRPTKEA
jgi:BASS family bile acid:Na+ symporter